MFGKGVYVPEVSFDNQAKGHAKRSMVPKAVNQNPGCETGSGIGAMGVDRQMRVAFLTVHSTLVPSIIKTVALRG